MVRIAGVMVAVAVSVTVAVPVIVSAVHSLLIPGIVGVVLYLTVRLVNAYLNRW